MANYSHRFDVYFRTRFLCRLALFDDRSWRLSAHPDACRYRRLRHAINSAIIREYGSSDRRDWQNITLHPHPDRHRESRN